MLDKMAQLDKSALVHNLPQRPKAEFKDGQAAKNTGKNI